MRKKSQETALPIVCESVMIFNDQCKLVVDPYPEERMAITDIHMQQGQTSRA